jgi:hypothetical protein
MEAPDMSGLNKRGEYVQNEQTLMNPVTSVPSWFTTVPTHLYKVFMVENIRGDRIERGVKYFLSEQDAKTYYESVKHEKTSKMEKAYSIETFRVYDTVDNIPLKDEIQPNEMGLEIQIAKRTDFRMNTELTIDQIMARYMEERSFIKPK